MAFFPRAPLTRALVVNSPLCFVALGVLWTALLAEALQAGLAARIAHALSPHPTACLAAPSLLPSLDFARIATLFADPLTTLLAWVHLLMLDLLQARHVLVDGVVRGVATAHSVLLCFFFGPTGLLAHALTRALTPHTPPPSTHVPAA